MNPPASMASAARLTPQQDQAAMQDGAVLVLAGAGTGKTTVLTRAVVYRIREFGIKPHRLLAVTFTNKAAGEMAGRIRAALGTDEVPSWLGTFHGLAARQLRLDPEVAQLRPGFDILDADDCRRLLKRILKAMNVASGDEEGASGGKDPIKTMANRISRLKDMLITPDQAPGYFESQIARAERSGEPIDTIGLRLAARVYAEYQLRLREANAADFGDLLLWPTRAMQDDLAYRERWAGRFDAVLGDEYQDVNHAQYVWLKLTAEEHGRIFVVGDDDQCVFGWRNANVGYIRRFARDFPEASVFRLEENFRSTGRILAAANAVIAKDPERLGKTLFTSKEAGEKIEIVGFSDGAAEAAGIVAEIQRRHGLGTGFDKVAILYRTNFLSRAFEEALLRARIPYILVGDVGFYQRAEIKDALALLRLAAAPDDRQSDEAFRRVINTPPRGFGPKALEIVEAEAQWRKVSLLVAVETAELPPRCRAAGLGFADAVRQIGGNPEATLADRLSLLLDRTGYRAMLRESQAETTENRLENIQELLAIAGGFDSARELLDHAALSASRADNDETGKVRLMTMHGAKGLEFDEIFLPGWEEGSFPPQYGDPAEERRLAYVSLTRGKLRVTITFARWRRGNADPSRFIDDIPDEHQVLGWLHRQDRRRPDRSAFEPDPDLAEFDRRPWS